MSNSDNFYFFHVKVEATLKVIALLVSTNFWEKYTLYIKISNYLRCVDLIKKMKDFQSLNVDLNVTFWPFDFSKTLRNIHFTQDCYIEMLKYYLSFLYLVSSVTILSGRNKKKTATNKKTIKSNQYQKLSQSYALVTFY